MIEGPLPDRYRAVVFDMDGLLLDTELLWHRAEAELFARHGAEFSWDDKMARHRLQLQLHRRLLRRPAGVAARGGPGAGRRDGKPDGGAAARAGGRPPRRCRAGRAAAGPDVGWAWPRTRRATWSTAALATARITDAFDTIVTSDDVAESKPAPDIYLLACERLGVEPADALALEDSASGIAAAKAAGLTCIAVPQFAETDVSAADRVIDSLEDLLAET